MVWLWGILAAVLHFGFFLLESLMWKWSSAHVFRVPSLKGLPLVDARPPDPGDPAPNPTRLAHAYHRALSLFAFNMGFYNLFLSLGALAGLYWLSAGGKLLLSFVCLSMVGAGLVLLVSRRSLLGPLVQALPPALCLWSLWSSHP